MPNLVPIDTIIFPSDFMFKLIQKEKLELVTNCDRFASLKHSSVAPRIVQMTRNPGSIDISELNHITRLPAGHGWVRSYGVSAEDLTFQSFSASSAARVKRVVKNMNPFEPVVNKTT